ncbi:unnamed protein product, partial [Mesorhabditis belari]|uniref:Peptidase S1 domain-containing protein n=1 Tax=Mesorhabditis belari TaxID=2138241 RepID=A0AAF3F398_9BILA
MLLIAIFSTILCLCSTFKPREVTIDLTPKFLKDRELTKIDSTAQGMLKRKCFPSRSKRIINGEAEVDESSANFHWAVAIFKDDPVHGNLHCTGTLISPIHVLSAAHCFVEGISWDLSSFYVAAGAKCVKEVEECAKVGAKRVIAKVKNAVIPNERLSDRRKGADLIILLLDTAIFERDRDVLCSSASRADQGIGNGDSGSGLEYFEGDFANGKHYIVGISSYTYGVISF